MRRKDKQITAPEELEAVFKAGSIVTLCLMDNGSPYMVPLNYGYADGKLYFHSAREGRKAGLLESNPAVHGLVISQDELLCPEGATSACSLTTRYTSIMFEGRSEKIIDDAEKQRAMEVILGHYAMGHLPLPEGSLNTVFLYRIHVDARTGKQSPVKKPA